MSLHDVFDDLFYVFFLFTASALLRTLMLNNQSNSIHASTISVKLHQPCHQLTKSCDIDQLTKSHDTKTTDSNSQQPQSHQDLQAMMKTNVYDIYDKIKTIRLSLESMDSSMSMSSKDRRYSGTYTIPLSVYLGYIFVIKT